MKSRKVIINDSTLLPKLSFYLKALSCFGLFLFMSFWRRLLATEIL